MIEHSAERGELRAADLARRLGEIAYEMRRLRAVRHLGIRAMARELGISPTTLSRVERGEQPDIKTSRAILRYAGACACCGQRFVAVDDESPASTARSPGGKR